MLITNRQSRTPLPDDWNAVDHMSWNMSEIAYEQPWFVVTLRQFERTSSGAYVAWNRTLLVFSLPKLEEIVGYQKPEKLQLLEVHVVTPDDWNGSGSWLFDRLSAIWVAQSPSDLAATVEIYETQLGELYAHSSHQNDIASLISLSELKLRLPIETRASDSPLGR